MKFCRWRRLCGKHLVADKAKANDAGATAEADESPSSSDEEPEAAGRWRKGAAPKVKYKFRCVSCLRLASVLSLLCSTINDVIEEGGTMHKRLEHIVESKHSVKVIDMTGKKQKVYSGYDAFAQKAGYMLA